MKCDYKTWRSWCKGKIRVRVDLEDVYVCDKHFNAVNKLRRTYGMQEILNK